MVDNVNHLFLVRVVFSEYLINNHKLFSDLK